MIDKWAVWEAYRRVKANQGAAGVDRQSLQDFEQDLSGNLYKIWNRMSSGTYFPPPVKAVAIPKVGGGTRVLGVPTVADRIAQTVAAMALEPSVEPMFHPDSYGYRPGRSAIDAVRVCRERCWRDDWVIDLDLKSFFDTIPHDLLLRAVERHLDHDRRWVLLYVQRWLVAPLQREDGSLVARDRGSPPGSAISPLLANLFLHYAFDTWMVATFPTVPFERYAHDVVVHVRTERHAREVRTAITARLAECGLELNEAKTVTVYCRDEKRDGPYDGPTRFDFLGYTFRPRLVRTQTGRYFVGFTPAVADKAGKRMRSVIRRWRIHRRTTWTLDDLAREINPVTRGWITYYGRFHRSALYPTLHSIDKYLVRWLTRKYRRFRAAPGRAYAFLRAVKERQPDLFVHWQVATRTAG
ncbi:MAG: group II intron reverse transcriptase/maturase [Blastococcus sp.]